MPEQLIWVPDDTDRLNFKGEHPQMKKLMTLMLGMALAFGTVATTFAQDKKDDTKKDAKKKKGKKKTEGEKKGGL
jgi:hypothetical protein